MGTGVAASVPVLSVVIAWCNREELAVALSHNLPMFRDARCEVVVVNCGGDSSLLQRLLGRTPFAELRRVELPAPAFNKALALNMGTAVAPGARL
ncbi:MAG: glycosyl transferase family 2, partial [Acidobacteria bacterium]|nr:glycosyl transferase family 2 [Acidobacteriota bacterium]